jgi:hypothetical protein
MANESLVTPVEILTERFNEVETEARGLAMLMAGKMAEIAEFRFKKDMDALLTCVDPVNTFSDRTFDLRKKAGQLYQDLKKQIEAEKAKEISITDPAFVNIENLNRFKQQLEGMFGQNALDEDDIFDLNVSLPILQRSLVKALLTINGYEVLSRRRLNDGRYHVLPKNEKELIEFTGFEWEDEYFQNQGVYDSTEQDLIDRRDKASGEIIAFHVQHYLSSQQN